MVGKADMFEYMQSRMNVFTIEDNSADGNRKRKQNLCLERSEEWERRDERGGSTLEYVNVKSVRLLFCVVVPPCLIGDRLNHSPLIEVLALNFFRFQLAEHQQKFLDTLSLCLCRF